jgi:hypothetical protein
MNGPKFKYLRVAWSVAWGGVAVLLCVLWVRSYARSDSIFYSYGKDNIGIESRQGNLLPFFQQYGGSRDKWRLDSRVIDVSFPDSGHAPFSWHNRLPSYFSAAVPHWFLSILFTALVAAVWIKWPRRFRLRTLLIATTLVAVALGLIVWAS